jgi:hypothetical protein
MITVTIAGVDRTSKLSSLSINDTINSQVDTMDFTVEPTLSDTYVPALNDEVIVTRGATRIFAGVITTISDEMTGTNSLIYSINAIDYTFFLNRKLVTERYTNQTIAYIIADIVTKYAPTFTVSGVLADIEVASIAFNRITVSECLRKLADLVNYNWYVDYYKDIHFFATSGEPAPFVIESGNYIRESLTITKDISQIRNRIIVQGGDIPSPARTVLHAGNGETTTFATQYKFATMPTVTVDGVAQTVGIDYLNDDLSFDCMWNFNEKYVRFTAGNIPPLPSSGTTNIELIGQPLAPIIVNVPNALSISEYGEYEFPITDDSISSQDQALERALAELRAYSASIAEGSFDTYKAGLRSGQVVRIIDPLRGLDEDFVIQKVGYSFLSTDAVYDGIWSVTVATVKTVGIITVLQKLLLKENLTVDEQLTLVSYIELADVISSSDTMGTVATQTGPYTYGSAVYGFSKYN